MSATHGATRPGRVAFAVVHHDPPEVFIAEDEHVLSRLIALRVVATNRPEALPSTAAVDELRGCLLEERWADAIFSWVEMSGVVIDAYPDEIVWTEEALDAERAALEVRMTPLFRDTDE
jgi:hypothetical protein